MQSRHARTLAYAGLGFCLLVAGWGVLTDAGPSGASWLGLGGVPAGIQDSEGPLGVRARRLASFAVHGGGEGRAEISAWHPGTRRLFTVDAAGATVVVTDLASPANPRPVGALDLADGAPTVAGGPTSVAAHGDWVVVAVRADAPASPGVLAFFDAASLEPLGSVRVGSQPDMVAVAPNGRFVVAACEGAPSDDYAVDPVGSVAVVVLPSGGPAGLDEDAVRLARFEPFDERRAELLSRGVRIGAHARSVAADLEPEYVAIAPDSRSAWVTCQENDCLALVDLALARVVDLVPLPTKDWSAALPVHFVSGERVRWSDPPTVGTTAAGDVVHLAGVVGFAVARAGEEDATLLAVAGAGPVLRGAGGEAHHLLPYEPASLYSLAIRDATPPRLDGVHPIVGRDGRALVARAADADGRDVLGRALPDDPSALDVRGITAASDGAVWIADARGPALYEVSLLGDVRRSLSLEGAPLALALAHDPHSGTDGTLALIEDVGGGAARLRLVDAADGSTVGAAAYPLDPVPGNRVRGATWGGEHFTFLVLEATRGEDARVHRVRVGEDGTLSKHLYVDLGAAGVAPRGAAGLARLPDGRLVVGSDAQWGMEGARLDGSSGRVVRAEGSTLATEFAFVETEPAGFDASDRDGGPRLQPWPVLARPMPDAIAAFEVDGATYLATANEGDAREYGGDPGHVDLARVKHLELDPDAFPDAGALRRDENLGRLEVSTVDADTDGDGDVDRLVAFGARSFSIHAADGTLVHDSGDELERRTLALAPERFNSNGDEDSRDRRSDSKGPEPEGLVVGTVAGRPILAVGLERHGSVLVYDVSNPRAPRFLVALGGSRDVSPEGVLVVDAADSPTGHPLVVVTYEVSGTVAVYELGTGR